MIDILDRAANAVRAFVQRPEFVRLIEEAIASGGGLEQRLADQLAEQIRAQETPARRQWGGDRRDYIAKRAPRNPDAKQRALDEARRTGKVAEAAAAHGVGRATLYRALMERRK